MGDTALPSTADCVVVGAGFSGIYMLHALREDGYNAIVIETGSDVGGTWYWNRYPGARCDGPSVEYSYSFSDDIQQQWTWTEKYAAQPEIEAYARFVTDHLSLRDHMYFNTTVTTAHFDDETKRWTVTTDGGAKVDAAFVVMATGPLSTPKTPDIPGLDTFAGATLMTSRWPETPQDFANKRVGVVGTGSTGMQVVQALAPAVGELFVFQRTANYAVPARNRPLTAEETADVKRNYAALRSAQRETYGLNLNKSLNPKKATEVSAEERSAVFWERWTAGGTGFIAAFSDLITDEAANAAAATFLHDRIRETVHDPDVAELLIPRNQMVGGRRLQVEDGYYSAFNLSHVNLVDISNEPDFAVTASGVTTGTSSYDLDVLVLATGFDALTGSLAAIDIRGTSGARFREAWAEGPLTYLGLMVPDFPNFFITVGPGSPSVRTNMIPSIEQHVEWIRDCLRHMRQNNYTLVDAEHDAAVAWTQHVQDVASNTILFRTASWYNGSNVDGKARVFMPYVGGAPEYRRHCEQVVADGYRGFRFAQNKTANQRSNVNMASSR